MRIFFRFIYCTLAIFMIACLTWLAGGCASNEVELPFTAPSLNTKHVRRM